MDPHIYLCPPLISSWLPKLNITTRTSSDLYARQILIPKTHNLSLPQYPEDNARMHGSDCPKCGATGQSDKTCGSCGAVSHSHSFSNTIDIFSRRTKLILYSHALLSQLLATYPNFIVVRQWGWDSYGVRESFRIGNVVGFLTLSNLIVLHVFGQMGNGERSRAGMDGSWDVMESATYNLWNFNLHVVY